MHYIVTVNFGGKKNWILCYHFDTQTKLSKILEWLQYIEMEELLLQKFLNGSIKNLAMKKLGNIKKILHVFFQFTSCIILNGVIEEYTVFKTCDTQTVRETNFGDNLPVLMATLFSKLVRMMLTDRQDSHLTQYQEHAF